MLGLAATEGPSKSEGQLMTNRITNEGHRVISRGLERDVKQRNLRQCPLLLKVSMEPADLAHRNSARMSAPVHPASFWWNR